MLKKIDYQSIGIIHKYDQWNCPYTYPNTDFFVPPRFDTSIQN